jgi:hypothetical protein
MVDGRTLLAGCRRDDVHLLAPEERVELELLRLLSWKILVNGYLSDVDVRELILVPWPGAVKGDVAGGTIRGDLPELQLEDVPHPLRKFHPPTEVVGEEE